jgi:hypothetical protein
LADGSDSDSDSDTAWEGPLSLSPDGPAGPTGALGTLDGEGSGEAKLARRGGNEGDLNVPADRDWPWVLDPAGEVVGQATCDMSAELQWVSNRQ